MSDNKGISDFTFEMSPVKDLAKGASLPIHDGSLPAFVRVYQDSLVAIVLSMKPPVEL